MVPWILSGITASICTLFLRFGQLVVLCALARDEYASIRSPTNEDIKTFQNSQGGKQSSLQDVSCVENGIQLHLKQCADCIIQNMFYNGWTHGHYVSNVFLFAPNCVIIMCAFNALGAMHESTVGEWSKIWKKLENIYTQTGGRSVVDSALSRGEYPFLIKLSQDPLASSNGNYGTIIQIQQDTSVR